MLCARVITKPAIATRLLYSVTQTVPAHEPLSWADLRGFQKFLDDHKSYFVITGAGLSTESGIPDYRSPLIGRFERPNASKPITIHEFHRNPNARQRYWARNFASYNKFSTFMPCSAHERLTYWERNGVLRWIVTQNVDGLHQKAGSTKVTELHGSMHKVVCTNSACSWSNPRADFQAHLQELNNKWTFDEATQILPDGDADLTWDQIKYFVEPKCPCCDSPVRPNVVFFGDSVPSERVEFARDQLRQSDCLIVFGSSLQTYSAFRFIPLAVELEKNIAIVNIGETRADDFCDLKIEGRCSEALSRLVV